MSFIQLRKVLRVVKAYKDLNEAERSEFDSIARVSAGGDTPARIAELEAELVETRKRADYATARGGAPVRELFARAEKAEAELARVWEKVRLAENQARGLEAGIHWWKEKTEKAEAEVERLRRVCDSQNLLIELGQEARA